jgi:hypothetical protein
MVNNLWPLVSDVERWGLANIPQSPSDSKTSAPGKVLAMAGEKKKVLVVVLAVDAEPWRSIEEFGQRGTWAKAGSSIPVMWLHGLDSGFLRLVILGIAKCLGELRAYRAQRMFRRKTGAWLARRDVRVVGRDILTGVPESYLTTNAKTVAAFRHLLKTEDFDFILRTNSSSYVDLERLDQFVQAIPDGGYYGGAVWRAQGLEFVTGSTILISRDLVELAAFDERWDFDLIDDMALGWSMRRAGVTCQSIERVDVLSEDSILSLSEEALASAFLVRCKVEADRSGDIRAMRRVHDLFAAIQQSAHLKVADGS